MKISLPPVSNIMFPVLNMFFCFLCIDKVNRILFQVRDNLYAAWRKGELNAEVDDDGKPMPIPPVPHVDDPIEMQVSSI